jgi:hypothetical protein
MGDIEKLPKWAQQHIASLEDKAAWLLTKLTEAERAAGLSRSETFVMHVTDPAATYRWRIDDQLAIDARMERQRLTVRAVEGRLAVLPDVSNGVTVAVIDYFGEMR